MRLNFCADDIKFSDFDPRTMIVEVESRAHLIEFWKAAKLAFPDMVKNSLEDEWSMYNRQTRFYCLDFTSYISMVKGMREWYRDYEVVTVEELVYIPQLAPSEIDIKYLFEK